jgi:hypothetical protein
MPSDGPVRLANAGEKLQQPVSEPLMISLTVIVGHILGERVPKQCRRTLTSSPSASSRLWLNTSAKLLARVRRPLWLQHARCQVG